MSDRGGSGRYGHDDWNPSFDHTVEPTELLASWAMSRAIARVRSQLQPDAKVTDFRSRIYPGRSAWTGDQERKACARVLGRERDKVVLSEFLDWCRAAGVEPAEVLGSGARDRQAYPPLYRHALEGLRSDERPFFRTVPQLNWDAVCRSAGQQLAEFDHLAAGFVTATEVRVQVVRAIAETGGAGAALLRPQEGRLAVDDDACASFVIETASRVKVNVAVASSVETARSLIPVLLAPDCDVLVLAIRDPASSLFDDVVPGLTSMEGGEQVVIPDRAFEGAKLAVPDSPLEWLSLGTHVPKSSSGLTVQALGSKRA